METRWSILEMRFIRHIVVASVMAVIAIAIVFFMSVDRVSVARANQKKAMIESVEWLRKVFKRDAEEGRKKIHAFITCEAKMIVFSEDVIYGLIRGTYVIMVRKSGSIELFELIPMQE